MERVVEQVTFIVWFLLKVFLKKIFYVICNAAREVLSSNHVTSLPINVHEYTYVKLTFATILEVA